MVSTLTQPQLDLQKTPQYRKIGILSSGHLHPWSCGLHHEHKGICGLEGGLPEISHQKSLNSQ